MEYYCLSREEYRNLIQHIISSDNLDDNLNSIVQRAKNDWDINIVGSNYFLGKIIEHFMKREIIDIEFITQIYELENSLFFSIDNLDYKLVDKLFLDHLPEKYNLYNQVLNEAQRMNDLNRIELYEGKLASAFEEDLLNIIESYYESEIYR